MSKQEIQYEKDMKLWEDLMKLGEQGLADKMLDWFGVVFMGCGILLMSLGTATIFYFAIKGSL